jgi:small conductance mechanosensitive channel
MNRLILAVFAFTLLLAPSFASQTASQELADLKAAQTQLTQAKETAAANTENADLQTALDQAQTRFDDAVTAAKAKRDQLKESDPAAYETFNTSLNEIAPAGNDLEEGLSWIQNSIAKGKTFIQENGMAYLLKAVMFLVIVLVFKILAKIAGSLTLKALSSNKLKLSELLKKFFVGIVTKIVFFAGILIALGSIGVDTGPILAGAGVVGFVVGFALQDTLSNFAAGIMILMYRPFDVGDVISAAGETGKVADLTLVSTTLLTGDNQKLIVPNSKIWGSTIRNITAQDTRRIDFTIGVGYGDDLDKVQDLLREVASSHELVLKDKDVQVEVHTLNESSVDFIVRPWTKSGDYWTVYFALTKEFKKRLDAGGFSIPYPQRDLHLITTPEGMLKAK